MAAKNCTNRAKLHQNAPYEQNATKPKVLPRGISISPAANWAVPPKAKALASTRGTLVPVNQPAFTMLSIQVVKAKPVKPSGAGLASFITDVLRSGGWNAPGSLTMVIGARIGFAFRRTATVRQLPQRRRHRH